MSIFSKKYKHDERDGVSIELSQEDRPAFERTYTCKIDGGFTVQITMRTFLGQHSRQCWAATVTQRDGKKISYEPEAVADKIIDRELYPAVQACTDKILAMDKEFNKSLPASFQDQDGYVWERRK